MGYPIWFKPGSTRPKPVERRPRPASQALRPPFPFWASAREKPLLQICTLQNQSESQFPVTMSTAKPVREKVAAHRQRLREAGRIYVSTDLPTDLVDCLDKIKSERGLASRAQVFELALKAFVENEMRA